MAEGIDVAPDSTTILLEEGLKLHQSLMAETRANEQSAHSIVRHSGARKFNQEDPIEAATVEMILSGSPNTNISQPTPSGNPGTGPS